MSQDILGDYLMIIPGINVLTYEEIVAKVMLIEFSTRLAQIDFEDGNAVDGKSFLGIAKLNDIVTKLRFDLDLMVENPIPYLEIKIRNADKMSFLVDTDAHVEEFISRAKKLGYSVGLALRPTAQITKIEKYMSDINYVQLYGVKPGGSGREFQISVLDKIEEFRNTYGNFPLQVDGGVDKDYLPLILKAGADDVIMTSQIFGAENPKEALENFVEISKRF